MSLAQEVTDILSEAAGVPAAKSRDNMDMALKELTRLMSASGETMFDICLRAEAAVTSGEARAAFKQFNLLMRILLEAAPGLEHEGLLRQAILTIKVSQRFGEAISSASSIRTAIKEYKIGILQCLAHAIRQRALQQRQDDEMDAELFSTFLPEPRSPLSESDQLIKAAGGDVAVKRGISEVSDLTSIPKKKPRVPEVASVEEVLAASGDDIASSKKILLTRERLRAGLNSPKGLLDLVGPSTTALDRTKRLELLKGAGMSFKGPSRSFSDRLNAAIQRLDLGLGGHSIADTLLFGAKVMSCPGALSKKNITDVENNLINGSTT